MATQPLFLSPEEPHGHLIKVDTALESMRDAGFDLTAAAGEPLDNSIEADATILRIQSVYSADKKSIEQLIFADNGTGIDPSILHHVLSMGYSNRYGQRQGLGRFGVGLKLAGLSLGERIDVYTKRSGDPRIYHTYFDLQEIGKGLQRYTSTTVGTEWPAVAEQLMKDPTSRDKNSPVSDFDSGTVVIFGKIDRLSGGGRYGASLPEKFADLRKFIARAYRKYLDTGRSIQLDGKEITLHDPLFLMDNPRIIERYKPKDPRGTVIEEDDLLVDGQKVHVTVTIVPEEFRPYSGAGGNYDSDGRDIHEFQINAETAGKVSILRNGREIYYDIVPKLIDGGRTNKVNRYVGIEVSFPATLDEYFQVRHVKRGAEPVSKLREELRKWLERPVRKARRDVRAYWQYQDIKRRVDEGEHAGSMGIAEAAEVRLPKGQAGRTVTPEAQEEATLQAIDDLNLDPEEEGYAARVAQIRELIETKPIPLLDASWPGKELFDVTHLNNKSLVKLNKRHLFFREVYTPIKKVADEGADGMAPEDMLDLATRARDAIDLLLMAFARAESMHADTEQFDGLRSYWGMFTEAYLKEQLEQ